MENKPKLSKSCILKIVKNNNINNITEPCYEKINNIIYNELERILKLTENIYISGSKSDNSNNISIPLERFDSVTHNIVNSLYNQQKGYNIKIINSIHINNILKLMGYNISDKLE
jgi:hypothetical protein